MTKVRVNLISKDRYGCTFYRTDSCQSIRCDLVVFLNASAVARTSTDDTVVFVLKDPIVLNDAITSEEVLSNRDDPILSTALNGIKHY